MAEKTPVTDANVLRKPEVHGTICFHYIKSNQFRVIHVDGIYGGITPNGRFIQADIFSERSPIPQKLECKLSDNGTVGAIVKREQKDGIVREVEAELLIDISTAKQIIEWMENKIKEHEEHVKKRLKES